MMTNQNKIKGALYGVLVGDAIGVPVEMVQRDYLTNHPIIGMSGKGSHNLPPGRWSDDGSLTLALADSLLQSPENLNLKDIADRMVNWLNNGHYTPDGYSFGTGRTTRNALSNYKLTKDPTNCGGISNANNGNGSLMRILPLLFYLNKNEPWTDDRYRITKEVSSITHGHLTSIISCFYLLYFADGINEGFDKFGAYRDARLHFLSDLAMCLTDNPDDLDFIKPFERLLYADIHELPADRINSGFFVVETLEAAIWCIMTTDNFQDAILKAVNLGGDSDSTASVVGGLAGFLYGYDAIRSTWIDALPLKKVDKEIIEQFSKVFAEDERTELEAENE